MTALLDVSMDAWEPHVSKDGQKLVFQSFRNGSFDLYEVALGEREPIPEALTFSPFDDREPHYSPDGNQILFSSDRSASYEIWLLDGDSKVAEQLTKTSGEAHSPAWSNESQAYAYILQERHGNRIFIANLETNEHVEVFATRNDIKGLAWVPSDSAISFWSLEKTAMGVSTSLNILNLVSKTTLRVTPPAMDVFPFRANWLTDEEAVFTADGQIQHLHPSGSISPAAMSVQVTLRRPAYTRKKNNFDRSSPKRALGISTR